MPATPRTVAPRAGRPADTAETSAASIADAITAYPGQWVVMSVAELDARSQPLRGVILHHSRSRARASEAARALDRLPDGTGGIYLFHADAASVPRPGADGRSA